MQQSTDNYVDLSTDHETFPNNSITFIPMMTILIPANDQFKNLK